MFTEKEQEAFAHAASNPIDFLKEEFQEGGAFCTSIFNTDDLENDHIVIRFSGGLAPSVHLDVWGQYRGVVSHVSYLAFLKTLYAKEPWWRISMVDLSEVYTPYDYTGTAVTLAYEEAERSWRKAKARVGGDTGDAVAWFFPRGTLGSENQPWLTDYYANSAAQEGNTHVL